MDDELQTLTLGLSKYACKPLEPSWVLPLRRPIAASSAHTLPFPSVPRADALAAAAHARRHESDDDNVVSILPFLAHPAPSGRVRRVLLQTPTHTLYITAPAQETIRSRNLHVRHFPLYFAACLLSVLAVSKAPAALLSATAADSGASDLTDFGPSVAITLVDGVQPADTGTQVTGLVGGGSDFLGTTAVIMETDAAGSIDMSWRNRAQLEQHRNNPPLPDFAAYLCSDVVNVTGFDGTYALEMSYSPNVEHADDASVDALDGHLFLGLLDQSQSPAEWVNAGNGSNTGSIAPYSGQPFQGDYAEFRETHLDPLSQYVGYWGVDTEDHTVWAVLDTSGEFAAVPEPSSIALLAGGVLCLAGFALRYCRRQRVA